MKNVVIFSDGTGQGASMPKAERTNVCKLWQAAKAADKTKQVTFYDAGLGSSDDKGGLGIWRGTYNLVSKATGLGISRNIKDCYDALIRFYEPDDCIFLFGFSRGAYTVRSLGGVLSLCGIPRHDAKGKNPRVDKAAREVLVEEAVENIYKHYGNDEATKAERKKLGQEFRAKYDGNLKDSADPPVPYFIGVWDTVRALGMPGSSGLVGWRHAFHDATLNPRVNYARHAISIDENREIFEPVLWEETPQDRERGRIKQRWFPGVHSDVGGGYEDAKLSDLALEWMIGEALAVEQPLVVDNTKLKLSPSHAGKQHDERTGLGNFWVQGTREKFAPEHLHEEFVEKRFKETNVPVLDKSAPYRPAALRDNKVYKPYYQD